MNYINQLKEMMGQGMSFLALYKSGTGAKEPHQRRTIEENLEGRIDEARISHVIKSNRTMRH